MPRYYEDLAVGERTECGEFTFTSENIVEFAKQYDPLPFHLEDAESATSVFDGLVASGLQTIAVTHRLVVDGFLSDVAVLGGYGIEEAIMHRPMRPGDTITAHAEVIRKEELESNPDAGHTPIREVATDSEGEEVMSMVALSIVEQAK